MAVKLFVGGLSYSTTSEGLRDTFAAVGTVESASIVTDRDTGRSRRRKMRIRRSVGSMARASTAARSRSKSRPVPGLAAVAAGAASQPASRPAYSPRIRMSSSSVTWKCVRTRSRVISMSPRMSAAVAPPRLMM